MVYIDEASLTASQLAAIKAVLEAQSSSKPGWLDAPATLWNIWLGLLGSFLCTLVAHCLVAAILGRGPYRDGRLDAVDKVIIKFCTTLGVLTLVIPLSVPGFCVAVVVLSVWIFALPFGWFLEKEVHISDAAQWVARACYEVALALYALALVFWRLIAFVLGFVAAIGRYIVIRAVECLQESHRRHKEADDAYSKGLKDWINKYDDMRLVEGVMVHWSDKALEHGEDD
ncbi:hypothetical protein CLAFUW4_13138 [Fulvia fulva]|uniref:Transmembrane protein n=1 Tax=Passalora fulva TaxID=5499 RepID=A0A9Q8PK37_PASFU|nr:uncharacterized protein CLAFUR5_12996 [Fulvia fulva]KAK4612066.1 hypothetical protein CLAFUR4_13143 [Fulvia fulva]KAK4612744.1 hypothetical protein CLAFUR0_13147 [Fulvia fulva]UJO23839.1 hypothetical protein CLAFUR5_12996 [Fulvia fulva]WPV21403.1 hypothetical protein CLAFUW4_13138 [Fulvia fulva]WPV36505.1 hypothetical protein CLAFUW7_13146 [Fulvia fulva]